MNRYYFGGLFLFIPLNPVERQQIPTTHLVGIPDALTMEINVTERYFFNPLSQRWKQETDKAVESWQRSNSK